jgi:hypothetical protein
VTIQLRPVPWYEEDSLRRQRDREEVQRFAPDLQVVEPSAEDPNGGWSGRLPLWPFNRAAPEGIASIFPAGGLLVDIRYVPAYPMLPPEIYPIEPEPELYERSQATWHVLPNGALCLLQSVGQWQPAASLTELLLKAAGWHLEYSLMKQNIITRMSEHGIVSDSSHDYDLSAGAP